MKKDGKRDATYCRKWSNPHLKGEEKKKGKEKEQWIEHKTERTIRTTIKEYIGLSQIHVGC